MNEVGSAEAICNSMFDFLQEMKQARYHACETHNVPKKIASEYPPTLCFHVQAQVDLQLFEAAFTIVLLY